MNIDYVLRMQSRREESDGKFVSTEVSKSHENPTSTPRSRHDSSDEILKKKQGLEVMKIDIRKQPPNHVFPNQEFEVDYSFARSDGSCGSVSDSLPARYLAELPQIKIHPVLLQVDGKTGNRSPSKPIIAEYATLAVIENIRGSSGVFGTLKCRISYDSEERLKSSSKDRHRRIFYIMIASGKLESGSEIGNAYTRNISVAPYQMIISTPSTFENVFFKDQGGRDKCIEISASVVDDKQQPLYENIPLSLTLCYEGNDNFPTEEPIAVSDQKHLVVLGRVATRQHIDPDTGKAKIRFRIEDVSKNHQGQNFVLKVDADGPYHVSCGYSPPITIKSKPNKTANIRKGSLTSGSETSNDRVTLTSNPEGGDWRGPTNTFPIPESGEIPKESPDSFDGTGSTRLQEAYTGILNWVDEVVTGLYPLQWQVVGYAQNIDGSPDYNRPYHNMTNPNTFISRILGMYNESTRKHLRDLGDAMEQSATKSSSPSSPTHDSFDRDSAGGGYATYNPASRNQGHAFPMVPFEYAQQQHMYHAPLHPLPPHHLTHAMSPAGRPSMSSSGGIASRLPDLAVQYSTALPPREIRDSTSAYHLESPPSGFPLRTTQPPPYPHAPFIPYPHAVRSPIRYETDSRMEGLSGRGSGARYAPSSHSQEVASKRLKLGNTSFSNQAISSQPPTHGQQKGTMILQSPQQVRTPVQIRLGGSGGGSNDYESNNRESEVEYILAKQHKSLRTGQRLGFPAYSITKELLGFYREIPASSSQHKFVPIGQHAKDFGPTEIIQASEILSEAIVKESEAVHRLQDWGSIGNMLNRCLVYEWKRPLSESQQR